jgi:DNA-binding beta-propeller fold protein YncE
MISRLAGVLALGCAISAAAASPASQPADLLYVCVQDEAKIAVVDAASRAVLKTIDLQALGFTATAKPHYVVVEPDGSAWYVSLIGANRVVKFDRQDRIMAHYEMETPGMLALAPGNRLVATRSMSAVNPPKRIAIIERATMKGEEVEVLFARPHPMATTAAGYAYTGSLGVNQVANIALADQRVGITTLPGAIHSLVQFAVSPDGKTLVASTESSGQVLVFDVTAPASPKLVKSVGVGTMAFDPVFTPDGKFVWVPVKSSNALVILESATWTEVARITDDNLKQPQQIVFTSDGATAFVTNNNKMDHMADPAMAGHSMPGMDAPGALVIVNVKTRMVEQAIPLGKNLTGMGIRAAR